MERWLFTFFIGAVCSLFLPLTPSTHYVTLFAFVAILFAVLKRYRAFSGFFFAIAFMLFHAVQYENIWARNQIELQQVPYKWHQVTGKVVSLPTQNEQGVRFNFLATQFNHLELKKPLHIRLSWQQADKDKPADREQQAQENIKDISQGQRWKLWVKLKPAHGFANPGGFSYQTWLRQKNIHATGYVHSSKTKKARMYESKLMSSENNVRQSLIEAFEKLLPAHELSSLLFALGFGDRRTITLPQWQILEATGTQHLIAISGLHLGLVAMAAFWFFSGCLRLLPFSLFLPQNLKAKLLTSNHVYFSLTLTALFVLFYAYLAGFSLPTVRALTMLLLFWLARLLSIKLALSTWLLLAVFFIVLNAPFSIFSASFWLSLYAVTMIFYTLWRVSISYSKHKWIAAVKTLFIIQFGLTLLMLPIVALYANQWSVVAFFANLLAVPWMSITAIPLTIIAVIFVPLYPPLAHFLLVVALKSLSVIWAWLEWLSNFEWSLLSLSLNQVLIIVLFVSLILVCSLINLTVFIPSFKAMLIRIRNRIKVIALAMSLTLLLTSFSLQNSKNSNHWSLSVLDVGQGLSLVIQKENRVIIYDTGASYPSGFNLADAVVIPYLQSVGIDKIDKVIISHQDNDHAGGLSALKTKLTVNHVQANAKHLAPDNYCIKQRGFSWQGLEFEVLSPNEDFVSIQKSNDRSCVIRVSDGKNSVLLTGDITKKVEKQLLNENASLSTDILIVSHHGSNTSSTERFLKTVSPKHAIVSAGFLNRWRMPSEKLKNRFEKLAIPLVSTSDSGMVQFRFDENGYAISQYRTELWPFWFAN